MKSISELKGKKLNMVKLKITYSWGDEEPAIDCTTFAEAWDKALQMAIKEAETSGTEHNCEIGILFDKEQGIIRLHYTYDDEYCFYTIV